MVVKKQAEIISFVLRTAKITRRPEDGSVKEEIGDEIIHPWKELKALQGYEWIRDAASAISGEIREIESATYISVQENVPVYIAAQKTPYTHYSVAVFQDNKDGKIYDIAQRIAESRGVKVGDVVGLHILGCCSIMDIVVKKDISSKSLEDQGGIVGTLEEEEEEDE